MGDTSNEPSPISQTVKLLTEISGYVAGIIAYFLAITGRIKTDYPKTVAILTLIVTVIVLWTWRWPQINRKKSSGKSRAEHKPRKNQASSYWNQFIGPLRSSGKNTYSLSLSQRRIEIGVLCALTVVAIVRTGTKFPDVVQELNPPPYTLGAPCDHNAKQDALRVVIADFSETPGNETLFESRLKDEMQRQIRGKDVQICLLRANPVIQEQDQAKKAVEPNQADVLIWGRSDVQVVDANLEVNNPEIPNQNTWSFQGKPSDFQLREASHLTFLTQYVFSLLWYMQGQHLETRTSLEPAIRAVRDQDWVKEADNRKNLADGYFVLGLAYAKDETITETMRLEKARASYTSAIELNPSLNRAVLNRSEICLELGDSECVLTDTTSLIDRRSDVNESLLVSAYANRSYAREDLGDLSGAISDLKSAIEITPDDAGYYHDLGQAQLLSGDYEEAIKTYNAILPYLSDAETRDEYVADLHDLTPPVDADDRFQKTVDQIVQILEKAKFP